jgi:hypothetical protein
MDKKKTEEITARGARLQARTAKSSKPQKEESDEEDGNESSVESASSGSEFTGTMPHLQNSVRDDSTYYPSISTTATEDVIKRWSPRKLREDGVPEGIIQEYKAAIGKDWHHKREVDQHGLKNCLRFIYLNSDKGINYVQTVLRQTMDTEELILKRNEARARTGRNSEFAKTQGHMLRTRRRDLYLRTLAQGHKNKSETYGCVTRS